MHGPCRPQTQDGAGHTYVNACRRGTGSGRAWSHRRPCLCLRSSSRIHALVPRSSARRRRGGWLRLSDLAFARTEAEGSKSSAALGTALPLCLPRRTQPYSPRFHQQLRRAPLLAIFREVVFLGFWFHLRAGHVRLSSSGFNGSLSVLVD